MTHLIAMRQRIKAVETIKKITHAMRLISMSTHSRLRHKKENLEQYKQAINKLMLNITHNNNFNNTIFNNSHSNKELIILIGSQKTLCGSFNNNLFKFFTHKTSKLKSNAHKYNFISVGKEAGEYLKQKHNSFFKRFDNFSAANFVFISEEISRIILDSTSKYKSVVVYCNQPTSFFVQQPNENKLFPLKTLSIKDINQNLKEKDDDYIWEYPIEEIYQQLTILTIKANLQQLLFDSLLAEQAARFIAMDSATRNADKIIHQMRIEYNKTRQAQITRELIDLTSGTI